jgi:hypothetical protein
MLRRLLRFCALLVLVLAVGTPAVRAQAPAPQAEKAEQSTSALPYVFAILYAMLVLMIVCVPSRKA